jgi:hypothetical protein
MNDHRLSAAERAMLDRIGDVLIPSADGMPSMSASDPDGRWLNQACDARPDLVDSLSALLKRYPGLDTLEAVARAEADDSGGVAALLSIAAGRYYMNPAVRRLLGYPGQVGRGPETPVYGWEGAMDLLERVVSRGPVYREAR